jgi:hypothetical protein
VGLSEQTVLVVALLMAWMMVASPAMKAPGNNGKGAAHANANASSGITTAVSHSPCDACQ